jgi:hypothetical protein
MKYYSFNKAKSILADLGNKVESAYLGMAED